MTASTPQIEPSFADAIAIIERSDDLPAEKKRHWCCSLKRIAEALDKPVAVIPARLGAIRAVLMQLHHEPLGVTAKTLSNHRANVKAALVWLGKEKAIPRHGAPLTPRWGPLKHQMMPDRSARSRLSPLMRYCSALGVDPEAVDEAVMDGFMAYRATATIRPADQIARRKLVRAWNSKIGKIDGWPSRQLIVPPVKSAGPAWEDFPDGLRQDIEQYLNQLARVRRSRTGQRLPPCKASTIRMRRLELAAAVRMAVKLGYPIQQFTSLGALLDPDVVYKIIDAYWRKNRQSQSASRLVLAAFFRPSPGRPAASTSGPAKSSMSCEQPLRNIAAVV